MIFEKDNISKVLKDSKEVKRKILERAREEGQTLPQAKVGFSNLAMSDNVHMSPKSPQTVPNSTQDRNFYAGFRTKVPHKIRGKAKPAF